MDYVDYTVTGRGGYGAERSAGYGAHGSAGNSRDSTSHKLASHRTADQRLAAGQADSGGGPYYVVRPGDTLWDISAQLDTTVHSLASANGIANPAIISAGERIYY